MLVDVRSVMTKAHQEVLQLAKERMLVLRLYLQATVLALDEGDVLADGLHAV